MNTIVQSYAARLPYVRCTCCIVPASIAGISDLTGPAPSLRYVSLLVLPATGATPSKSVTISRRTCPSHQPPLAPSYRV